MNPDSCPLESTLSEFVRCQVAADQADFIAEHISNCERCETTVTGLEKAAETLVWLPKGDGVTFRFQDEPELQRVIQAVKQRDHRPDLAGPIHSSILPLEQLRDYQIITKIGDGGMGAVYRAVHTRLNKTVALKVLSFARRQDEEAISRFQREMSIVGRLHHPNIVQALDAGEENGWHFLVMEYVAGIDLSALLRKSGPLPISAACEVIAQAAIGLQYAHENGLVHRDIKPSNVMLAQATNTGGSLEPQWVIKILDLGLARIQYSRMEQVSELTMDGQVMGTPDYMAPEQGDDSRSVDIRADIYSLGATLYKLLTGVAPFQGAGRRSLIHKLTALAIETPPSVRELRPDVPEALAALIARTLAKRPHDRFDQPADLVAALQPYRSGEDLPMLLGMPSPRISDTPTRTAADPTLINKRPRGRPAVARAVTWIFGIASILAVILFVSTKEGTVEIEPPEGGLPKDIRVEISQEGGHAVNVLQADGNWKASVAGEKIYLTLSGGADQFELVEDSLVVSRFGKNIVRLKKVAEPAIVANREDHPQQGPAAESERLQQTPQRSPDRSVSRGKPFVLIREGRKAGEFASLYGAVSQAVGSDVIEVHSTGPISLAMSEPITKSVHLRAGEGFRPLLVPRQQIRLHQGLVIEGCDVDQRSGFWGMDGVRSAEPWQFRRCRFWGGGFGYVNAPQLVVEDCIFDTSHGFTMVPSQPCEVTISNCAVRTSQTFLTVEGDQAVPVNIQCKANTFRFPETGVLFHVPPSAKHSIKITATGNLFEFPHGGPVRGMMSSSQWHGPVDWQGKENVYIGNWYREWDKESKFTEGLDVWNKLWTQPEHNSLEIPFVAFRGARHGDWTSTDLIPGIRAAVDQIKFQHHLTRIGPDWSLIGVGDSYLRALAIQGRAVPMDRLRPHVHADGPIVVIRNNNEFTGYPTLAAAIETAETADVIEIRTDDPIPSISGKGKGRRMTLRAGPGYSPIINGSFCLTDDRLTIEGLTFRGGCSNSDMPASLGGGHGAPFSGAGSFERLTNCVFLSNDVVGHGGWHGVLQVWGGFKTEGNQIPEIANCILGLAAAEVPDGGKLVIKNSILASVSMSVKGQQVPGELEITDSVLWTPDPGTATQLFAITTNSPLVLTSRNSVFASPGAIVEAFDVTNQLRRWSGTANVYIHSVAMINSTPHGAGATRTLDDLRKTHNSDTESIEMLPLSFDPENWRVWRERSTGYPVRAENADFGADIDRLSLAIAGSR